MRKVVHQFSMHSKQKRPRAGVGAEERQWLLIVPVHLLVKRFLGHRADTLPTITHERHASVEAAPYLLCCRGQTISFRPQLTPSRVWIIEINRIQRASGHVFQMPRAALVLQESLILKTAVRHDRVGIFVGVRIEKLAQKSATLNGSTSTVVGETVVERSSFFSTELSDPITTNLDFVTSFSRSS
jgi:hypothetical protein